jgi:aspartate/methionine/tyrosine aminotransferase
MAALQTFAHRFSQRIETCGTEDAFVVLAEAKRLEAEGRSIIHLQIGEPDFDTPSNVIAAAKDALSNHYTHYTASAGLMQMRERYAEYVNHRYGVSHVKAENIVIMPGAKPVVFLSSLALLDPGDEVIVLDPIYPAYMASVNLCGAVAKRLPLTEDTGFRFDHQRLRELVSNKTKLVYLNSPQNPTGGVLTAEDYAAVAELAREYGFYVLSDEIRLTQ